MSGRDSEGEYGRLLGPEALRRQKDAAQAYFSCCGEHRSGPHHEKCAKFVTDAPPPVIEGQGSLL